MRSTTTVRRRTLPRLVGPAAVLVMVLALGPAPALAGGGGDAECTARAASDAVRMFDSCIEPVALTATGSELEIANEGFMAHDYVSVDGAIDTGLLEPGEAVVVAAPPPGVYDVYCTLHGTAGGEGMAGTLIVAEAPGEPRAGAAGAGTGAPGGVTGAPDAGTRAPDGRAALAAANAGVPGVPATPAVTWLALLVAACALGLAGLALRRAMIARPGH